MKGACNISPPPINAINIRIKCPSNLELAPLRSTALLRTDGAYTRGPRVQQRSSAGQRPKWQLRSAMSQPGGVTLLQRPTPNAQRPKERGPTPTPSGNLPTPSKKNFSAQKKRRGGRGRGEERERERGGGRKEEGRGKGEGGKGKEKGGDQRPTPSLSHPTPNAQRPTSNALGKERL